MNFTPHLSTGAAVFMSLFAASLWGTWFISLKYLRDYPIQAFILTLFSTSLLLVWGVGLILDGPALFKNIRDVYSTTPYCVIVTFLCGILYVIGMSLSMTVLIKIGLSLSQPIQSSIYIIAGTLVSALVGGMPKDLSVVRLVVSVGFLLLAVVASVIAGELRSSAQKRGQGESSLTFSREELWKSIGLMAISALFTPAYTLAISYGLKSVTHPAGLAVLPFMALLASGAFVGAFIANAPVLTIRKQWSRLWNAPMSIHRWGIMSGLFHYGGNIIHTFATAFLSSVISWPLGVTSNLWTQVWGFIYGEFKGFPRRVYVALFAGFVFYLIGAFIIAM
jgi:glucose uptake protein GlcU